jgi:CheY-like chemotaxis protein
LLEPGFEVVGVALDGRELSQLAQGTKPDVILLDLGMPNLNGFDTGQQLRKLFPATEIVVVTMSEATRRMRLCANGHRDISPRPRPSESAESAIGFGRRLQRPQAAGLRIMGSFSIPTAPTNLLPAQTQRGRASRFMLWGCQGLTNPRRQTSPVVPARSAALPGQSPLAAEVHWAPSCQAINRVDYRGAFFLSQFVAGAGGDETVRSSFQV